jgi:hypothetical protein
LQDSTISVRFERSPYSVPGHPRRAPQRPVFSTSEKIAHSWYLRYQHCTILTIVQCSAPVASHKSTFLVLEVPTLYYPSASTVQCSAPVASHKSTFLVLEVPTLYYPNASTVQCSAPVANHKSTFLVLEVPTLHYPNVSTLLCTGRKS